MATDVMYTVKPHYRVMDVPACDVMYRVNKLTVASDGLGRQEGSQDLGQRQESLLQRLDSLIAEASKLQSQQPAATSNATSGVVCDFVALGQVLKDGCPTDLVIKANPDRPPRWLAVVKRSLEKTQIPTWWKFHTHSSATGASLPRAFPAQVPHENRRGYKLIITVVWMGGSQCPSLHTSPSTRTPICGETNILRFFARLLGVYDAPSSSDNDIIMDLCLDACDVIESPSSTNQEKLSTLKSIGSAVEKGSWFAGDALSLGGAFLTSVLTNYGVKNIPQDPLKKWIAKHEAQLKF